MMESLLTLWKSTGIYQLFSGPTDIWVKTLLMYAIVGVLVYLAIKKQFEPLLLLPIAIGMFLTNLPGAELFHMDLFINSDDPNAKVVLQEVFNKGGLIDILYLGVKFGVYPCLIFIGIGAMTDFSPLISNPKSIFLGGAAQLGVFAAFAGALQFQLARSGCAVEAVVQFLAQSTPRQVAVYLSLTLAMTAYHDAAGHMGQIHAIIRLVDFLAAFAAAVRTISTCAVFYKCS